MVYCCRRGINYYFNILNHPQKYGFTFESGSSKGFPRLVSSQGHLVSLSPETDAFMMELHLDLCKAALWEFTRLK